VAGALFEVLFGLEGFEGDAEFDDSGVDPDLLPQPETASTIESKDSGKNRATAVVRMKVLLKYTCADMRGAPGYSKSEDMESQ
jgi:hypothetical protein